MGGALTDDELRALADPSWRLAHLYSIVTDDSEEIRFVPNHEQLALLDRLWHRNLILKARQLGFSTMVLLMALDQCLFNTNFVAVTIADSLENAEKLFRRKVQFAYSRLPQLVRDMTPVVKETSGELVFGNGSSISVTTSARSGTVHLLHVSEMGKIGRKYPDKAREIVTGSFEAVPSSGMVIVESTAEENVGWFHDACMAAHRRRLSGQRETVLDWRLHFYPWWTKPDYSLPAEGVVVSDATRTYFERIGLATGHAFTPEQRAWWAKKSESLGDDMKREYPATVEEAFERNVDGMIYGKEMLLIRALGRIGTVPHRRGVAINTFWDLGVNDANAIWLHQRVGAMNRFIRYIYASNEGIGYYWRELEKLREEWGGTWGVHYLPHDGDARIQGFEVRTRKQILEEAGARNVTIVPRIADVRAGVDQVKGLLQECEFDAEGCADGLKALENYSREWDGARQTWASHPRHDWASNGADAFRQFAQSFRPNTDHRAPTVALVNYGRGGY